MEERGAPPFLLAELVKGGGFLTFLAYSPLGSISYERRGTTNWSMHINYALLAKTGAPPPPSPTSRGGWQAIMGNALLRQLLHRLLASRC